MRISDIRRLATHAALGVAALTILTTATALGAASPYDWFTQSQQDVLNYEATGPRGDAWTVASLMGGVGYGNISVSNQYASVAYPGQYVVQDNALGKGPGAGNGEFCDTVGCRNHSRVWGIPFMNSTDSIQAVSTEHWAGCCTHIVDSYNTGRDQLAWEMWPYDWVRWQTWVTRYGSSCVSQWNGTCAPYNGQAVYQCITDTGTGCETIITSAPTQTFVKPAGEKGVPPPPGLK